MKGVFQMMMVSGVFLCLLGCGTGRTSQESQPAEVPGELMGHWKGTLSVQGSELPLVFHFQMEGGILTGSMDSPAQGAYGIAMDGIALSEEGFTASFLKGSATLQGTFAALPDSLEAEWIQGGGRFPLVLTPDRESEARLRPQEPERPFPYREVEVSFQNPGAGITLAGTLTLPETGGPCPAVLLVGGSGQQNRDEEVFGHKPFLVLSDFLTRRGLAVLRYDDRGMGGSGGSEGLETATTADFTGDAAAALAFLRGRPEIRPGAVGVIGHSEGGIIGEMLAAGNEGPDFLVMMAGPALQGRDTLLRQSEAVMRSSGAREEEIASVRDFNSNVYEILLEDSDEASLRERIGEALADSPMSEETAAAQMNTLMSPWFRYFLAFDPADYLERISVPVLALFGEKDVQVVAEYEAPLMRDLLKHNSRATVEVLPGLNHMFQEAETGAVEEYVEIEQTLSPVFLDLLAEWLEEFAFNGR